MKQKTRRELLRQAGCGLLGRAAFVSGFDRFSLVSALAAPIAPTDYKALVCIFMFGGNDSNNTVISLDNYTSYANSRGILALTQAQLAATAINPKSGGHYALHPSMTGAASLFKNGKLSILANVGTLTAPLTKAMYVSGASRPYQLFSHSDQQSQWQTSVSTTDSPFGWGGRMADQTQDAATGFPTISSLAGVSIFSAGQITQPIALQAAPTPLNNTLNLRHPDTSFSTILGYDSASTAPTLVGAADTITQNAVNNSALLNTNPTIATVFPSTGLANQLLQVAKLIKLSSTLGLKRQIFFCSIGGFDTHTVQLTTQSSLLGQLSDAMAAFYNATVEIGVASKVTTFTLSDFSRTFVPAGTAAATVGSDHAWGSHHFIMGDSVAGGDLYGTFPDLVVGGNFDTDVGTGARGRWIPGTAVDEYASTLATWYGLTPSDLGLVFPNVANGTFPSSNLGFMMP
jgi:uncharacterized protein (DUF1501 family)